MIVEALESHQAASLLVETHEFPQGSLEMRTDRLTDLEAELVLRSVNRESACLVLAHLNDKPQTSASVCENYGKTRVPTEGFVDARKIKLTLDYFPDEVVERSDKGYRLTPLGQTARAFAGHLLTIDVRNEDLAIVSVFGSNDDASPSKDADSYSHLNRTLLLFSIYAAGKDGVHSTQFREKAAQYGMGRGTYEGNLKRMKRSGLIEVVPGPGQSKVYRALPEHSKVVDTLQRSTSLIFRRNPWHIAIGQELATRISETQTSHLLAARVY